MDYFVHQSAFVDDGAEIGKNTKIWHNVHVASSAKVGADCSIGKNAFIAGIVGSNCKIQNNVNIFEGVELADYVFCGPSMTFTNVRVPRAKYPVNKQYNKTIVEEGATFGANCTVVSGITIGKWAMIGAGAVVTKDVPPYALVYGNPGRIKGWVSEHGCVFSVDFKEAQCQISGDQYKREEERVFKVK